MITNQLILRKKNKKVALFLCALGFLGLGGIHDFYLGNVDEGIEKLMTFNWLFIGTIYDIILIKVDNYKNMSGLRLEL